MRKFCMIVLALVGACALLMTYDPSSFSQHTGETSGANQPQISNGVEELAQLKSESEQWAHRIKHDYSSSSEELKRAETLYIFAKASVDGYLAQVKFDLATGKPLADSPSYESAREDAATKGKAFAQYVNSLYAKGLSLSGLQLIGDVPKELTDAGINIWSEFQKASDQKRTRIIEQLDGLKWESFDKV